MSFLTHKDSKEKRLPGQQQSICKPTDVESVVQRHLEFQGVCAYAIASLELRQAAALGVVYAYSLHSVVSHPLCVYS